MKPNTKKNKAPAKAKTPVKNQNSSFVSQAEFARMAGIPKTSLPAYEKNSSIVIDAETRKIDLSIEKNQAFIEKMKSRAIEKNPGITDRNTANTKTSYAELEKEKLIQNIKKLENENEILQLKKTKIRNEAILMDDAKSAFAIFIGSVSNAFLNAYEAVLTDLKGELGLTREKVAEIKSRLIPTHNQAVETAVKQAKKQMALSADYYSDKLERGEKH
jgi:DNA-binding XRE family transcriptional regulator